MSEPTEESELKIDNQGTTKMELGKWALLFVDLSSFQPIIQNRIGNQSHSHTSEYFYLTIQHDMTIERIFTESYVRYTIPCSSNPLRQYSERSFVLRRYRIQIQDRSFNITLRDFSSMITTPEEVYSNAMGWELCRSISCSHLPHPLPSIDSHLSSDGIPLPKTLDP